MTPYSSKSSFNFLKKEILVLTFKALIEKYDDNSMVSNNTQKNTLNKNNDINGTVVPNFCGLTLLTAARFKLNFIPILSRQKPFF